MLDPDRASQSSPACPNPPPNPRVNNRARRMSRSPRELMFFGCFPRTQRPTLFPKPQTSLLPFPSGPCGPRGSASGCEAELLVVT
ncbi:uncharacterized protein CLUP02_17555 [Colletotrichum lupini]|uniref:Uncharacterized protein n=1 Tax=Colletotrichum lupini TaxID=145971 RepID=A0A9Q8WAC4_9PEZI|nr:uncharacterized protein CLUP02_17555 [Colletotrichum lupini]UQC76044.1 hypothetical protein CLUP02_17555 [Colletotrichum lupini]